MCMRERERETEREREREREREKGGGGGGGGREGGRGNKLRLQCLLIQAAITLKQTTRDAYPGIIFTTVTKYRLLYNLQVNLQ